MSSQMVGSLSYQDLDVDYTDLTTQPDDGGKVNPQECMDTNRQLPAPEASTSRLPAIGDNPPIASELVPIPAMGATFMRMRFRPLS